MKEEALTLLQINDLSVLTQRASLLPKLSEEFTAIMKEDDVSLADSAPRSRTGTRTALARATCRCYT